MASGTAPPKHPSNTPPAPSTRYEAFIEGRLQYTRRQVKLVDIAGGLLVLSIGTLAFLLTVAVLDQWVIAGGLRFGARLTLWLLWVALAGYYFWRRVLPAIVYRINPLYAAHTIERSGSSLKNSLINFLLLRGHRQEVPAAIYQALEHRAATDLTAVNLDVAVDRGRVLRHSYVLAAVVLLFALYLVFSPKNPLVSAARVLWPWARIAAPTRVMIDDVQPGNTRAFFGETVEVSALVRGLREGEPVTLLASTADGQVVDQPIAMAPFGEASRYKAALPPGSLGLQQDMSYRITAGDTSAGPFQIEAQVAPSIVVDEIEYEYPRYTGLPSAKDRAQGNVRAIEGTRVTVRATANREIEEAKIDLNSSGLRIVRMSSTGTKARGQFTLSFDPERPERPLYDNYQILFTDKDGQQNRRPVRYTIDVIRDLAPEVEVLAPKDEEVSMPVDGKLPIQVRAKDPDYALRRVAVRAQREGKDLDLRPILDLRRPEKPHQGQFEGVYLFEPAKLGLKPGDRVRYWAEAEDNKEPTANHSESPTRIIQITAPDGPPQQANEQPHRAQRDPRDQQRAKRDPRDPGQKQPADPQDQTQDQPQDQQGDPQQGKTTPDAKRDPNAPGSKQQEEGGRGKAEGGRPEQPNSGQQDQPGEKNSQDGTGEKSKRVDPGAQQGDAIEKILKDREKQQPPQEGGGGKAEGGRQPEGGQQPEGEQQGEKQSNGGEKSENQDNPSGGQQGEKQPTGGQQGEKQPTGGQQGEQKSPGGQSKSGEKQSTDGEKPQSQNNPSDGQQGEKQSTGGQQGEKQSTGGQSKSGERQSTGGEKSENQDNPAGGQQGEKQPTGGQQGEQKSPGGQSKSGEKQSTGGEKSENQDNPSGGQQGEKQSTGGESGEQKPAGGGQSKPDAKQPPGGDKSGSENGSSAGEKPEAKQPGSKSGGEDGSSGAQPKAGEKPEPGDSSGGESGSQEKPDQGQKPSGSGSESGAQKPEGKQGSSHPKSGSEEGSPRQQDPGQKGDGSKQPGRGSPAPQGDNQPTNKKPEGAGPSNDQQDTPDSPTTSPHQSTGTGESEGDHSGRGKKGGGQNSPQPGQGKPGSKTASDEGGNPSGERGPGETGEKPGDQVRSKQPTGKAGNDAGEGENQPSPEGGRRKAEGGRPQQPGSKQSNQPGSPGAGPPTSGGRPGEMPSGKPASPKPDRGADDANLEFSRKQVDLALEHLKDQLAKDKPEVLDKLGWSREDAQRFLDSWNGRMAAAKESGAKGEAARRSLDESLKNLGLRPRGTRLGGNRTKTDQLQNLRDPGQFEPPSDWSEAMGAFSRSLGSEKKE